MLFIRTGLCILIFLSFFGLVQASAGVFESGLTLREISQVQQWPKEFASKKHVSSPLTSTFQGLARYWTKANLGRVRFKFEYELSAFHETGSFFSGNVKGWNQDFEAGAYERLKLRSLIFENRYSKLRANVERLDFSWSLNRFDIDFGRQPVSLGTSHFIGILDVLAPFYPGYLDSSYKPGIDALRIRTGFGNSGEAELIGASARDPSFSALLGRLRNTFDGIDVEVLGGRFRDRNFVGLGWEGEKRKITMWGEVGVFERKRKIEFMRGGDSRFALSWIAGAEKEIRPKFRMGMAFMYQDFGVRKTSELATIRNDAPFKEGWAFLGASRYGLLSLRKEFTPLITGDLNYIYNLVDNSTFWQPKVAWSTGDNSDFTIFMGLKTGRGPQITGPFVVVPSEFGTFSSSLGFIIRRFF